jgi:cation diffusion facilitator family transporter
MNWRPTQAAWLSVVSNGLLVVLKLIVGTMIGSVAVISEAIHSGVDLLASFIALFAVRTSAKPPDHNHPYGHGKIESVSGTIEALLIFVAGAWIIYEAVGKLAHPESLKTPIIGAAVMALSALANILVSSILFRVARKHDSIALEADAWHLRTDVYTSAGVFVGMSVIAAQKAWFPGTNLDWVDPVSAIAVALLIMRTAYNLTTRSARDLVDTSLPKNEELWICECMHGLHDQVRGFHKLRTRKSGAQRFVDVHMLVDPEMSVARAHELADELVGRIKARYSRSTVTVHIEPGDGTEETLDCNGRLTLEPDGDE